jgi:hypothetical protein
MVLLAFAIGYIDDINSPKPHYYENEIVMVDKKYQCPKHCAVNHRHHVYFKSDTDGIVIDENLLGKKVKEKKSRKKK